jgi:HK97 family phage major capsid protein
MNIQGLYNEATELYGRARALLENPKGLSADDSAQYDRIMEQFDARMADAKRLERDASAASAVAQLSAPQQRLGIGGTASASDVEQRQLQLVRQWFKGGVLSAAERKDLSAGVDAQGGYLVAPAVLADGIIKFIDDEVYLRRLSTVIPMDVGTELIAPTWDVDPADADWLTEVASVTTDTSMRTGLRTLRPTRLSKEVKISRTLVNQSRINIEQWVQARLAYKFGITEEKAFLTGTGASGQPLGVFTASAQGIPTSRDTTAAATTSFTADNILDTKHALKAAYWSRPATRWCMHRDTIARIRKLKDGNGNYLWSPGLGPGGGITQGLPATICDVPYVVSEYAPNTFTTGQYVLMIGDFSYYYIAETGRYELQVLAELYASTDQIGYIGRTYVDGQPVLAEAFQRLKLA